MAPRVWIPYCPECSQKLTQGGRELEAARKLAGRHAAVTGHPVHVCHGAHWTVLETVAGEPSLPLW